ncbi:hypothetical protein ETAE_2353 [Edwardsiella piscicida]|uniref:Uncharacterized protein n=2 Tax=Edwardsiella TaxID=635 RepID=A0A0H3DSB5_EDWTF|nr:hypothetical protein ETAE_2353 [Edwardsiella tarda EIB202]ADM42231.1 hypothetical protein ETAF_2125 [Edwardsiella tarda FL6-60]
MTPLGGRMPEAHFSPAERLGAGKMLEHIFLCLIRKIQ